MRLTLTSFAFFLVLLPAMGQTEFSLYRLNANLPEANMLNPAFAPNSRLVIGLPVISSVYIAADNDGIAFRDLFKANENDSLKLDTLTLFSKLHDANRVQFKESVQLFYFGLRGKKSYFSLGIHQVMETRFTYPGDLIGWAIRGLGDHHYAGKPLDFSNFFVRSMVYNKVSANYGRDVTPKLRIGARFNYLLGVAAGESTSIRGKLTMGIDSVNLNLEQIHFQTAGADFFDQSDLGMSDYKNYFLNTKNKGMSLDVGAAYKLTDNLTLSAAVSDLGYISWKEYTRSYQVAPVNYTFKGFDLLDYLNKGQGDQFLAAEIDSLESLFTSTETTGNEFRTPLTGKFYAGANFRILRVNNFSALFYLDLFQKRIDPAVSLGYNLQLGRFLNTTIGFTYQNGKISNVGAGIALKLTNLQFYAASDRGNSFLYPSRASRADARIGMNLVFGKLKKKSDSSDKKEESEEEGEEKKEVEKGAEEKEVQENEPAPAPKETDHEAPEPVVEDEEATIEQPRETVLEAPIEPTESTVITPAVEEKKEEIVLEEPLPVVETAPVYDEPVVIAPEEPGSGRGDELPVGHYVIVGTFREKENAERYSNRLLAEGYPNETGFVTIKNVYYVYVRKSVSLEQAQDLRDQLRTTDRFQFAESWVLTVE